MSKFISFKVKNYGHCMVNNSISLEMFKICNCLFKKKFWWDFQQNSATVKIIFILHTCYIVPLVWKHNHNLYKNVPDIYISFLFKPSFSVFCIVAGKSRTNCINIIVYWYTIILYKVAGMVPCLYCSMYLLS